MTEEAPKLPTEISPNGQEIWDWAAKLSAYTQRQHRLRQLRADIAGIGKRCGHCDKWMKSSFCPREHNVNGHNRGPSGDASICKEFVECRFATKRRTELQSELDALSKEPAE